MDNNRHHHHSIHSCHLKHHANSGGGPNNGFDRYGGFPQLSRIFPPISSSSSTTSSTDSDIQVSRKFRFHRKWCACVAIAVLFVGLGAAAGIYFGYQFLSLTPPMEQTFRGRFDVEKGDVFKASLADASSASFRAKSAQYKSLIDALYSQSVVKNAFLESEILAFDGVEGETLSVFFNVHVDTHRIRVDAGDLFIIFADALRSSKGTLNSTDIHIDQDTLEIQERSMAFLYLPSTERNYVVISTGNDSSEEHSESHITPSFTSSKSSTPRPSSTLSSSSPPAHKSTSSSTSSRTSTSTTTSTSRPDNPNECSSLSVDFCANMSSGGFSRQRQLSDPTLLTLASVVESQCYPFAQHFVCTWGVACSKEEPSLLDKTGSSPLLPCRDYCDEFMSNCGSKFPSHLRSKFKCGGDWKGPGSCLPKPGCVSKLYAAGQSSRICDGVMDCTDFSDELHCPYCPPGHFHCGAGKECIPPDKKCDGVMDCPNGSDEKACLTLAPSSEAAGYVHQYFNEGYLFVHDQGRLGKLCVERNDSSALSSKAAAAAATLWAQESQLLLDNIGSSACELLGFRKVAFVRIQKDGEAPGSPGSSLLKSSSEEGTYVRIQEPGSSTEVTFSAGTCPSKKVLYVGCNHLECGQRPSHTRKSTGFAGHGDWPWHAALFKDGIHVCDATLVTSQWLLTSDACFAGAGKARWSVHFGRVRLSSVSPWQQERRVVGMVKSPLADSLVLIKMASPVIFSDFARHVCLPDEPNGRTGLGFPSWEKTPSKCVRLGWSKDDELVETSMHQLSHESCGGSISKSSPAGMCFENDPPGRDCVRSVRVFAGGPVYCQNEDTKEWALAGLATSDVRPKCGIEKTRLSAIGPSTEWILKTIEALTNSP